MSIIRTFILLIFSHQLADQPLQTTYICTAKRGQQQGCPAWLGQAYHAFMHAALVLMVTNSLACCAAEFIWHFSIDTAKCTGAIGMKADQLLHVGCKVVYVLYLAALKGGLLCL